MKTARLYYDDAYCREFEASIVRVEDRGDVRAVWLDRTAFYPTSGGQPFDTGVLGGGAVIEVVDEDDDIVHVVRGETALASGQRVHGAIDWARRFDHMQQHTGQHILSAAILRVAGVPTVSFHLGREAATIDLARELSPAELTAAEGEANRAVWEDRLVSVRYAEADAAGAKGLRKPSVRSGTLRLVEIDGVDLSACGGSHVSRTGAVGVIVITSWERCKGGQRVEFLCGGRVVTGFRLQRDAVASSLRLLSVLPSELPAAIERLQGDLKEQQKAVGAARAELASHRAEALVRQAELRDGVRFVFHAAEGDAGDLKTLASAVVDRPGVVAVLASTGLPALVVVARSKDARAACDQVVKALVTLFGGKGGGRPDFAQGGNLSARADAILAQARALVDG